MKTTESGPYFGRVVTAMITPLDHNLKIDEAATAKLARYLVANGSDGVVVMGTTGESATLSRDEKVRMYQIVKEALAGTEACVIAGTGSNNTEESIALTKAAEEVGLNGALVVVPYYNKPSQEGMYLHFKAVANSTRLPIMLYNVPGRTSSNLLPETVKLLSDDVHNIVAVKEASSDMQQCAFIGSLCKPSFEIYSGDDFVNLPLLALGGSGAVSVASHIIGSDIHRMHDLFFAGDIEGATKLHWKSLPLTKALFCTSNPVPVKYALTQMGVIPNANVRLPLAETTASERTLIEKALADYGITA